MRGFGLCLAGVFSLAGLLAAQDRVNRVTRAVDPQNLYERVVAIVPVVGAGTASNPKRPLLVDLPGIRAFGADFSADGKWALVEIVARDRANLQPAFTSPELAAARLQAAAVLQLKIANRADAAEADQVYAEWKRFKPAFERARFMVSAR